MKPGKLNKIVVLTCVIVLLVLSGLFARDTILTNRKVVRLSAFAPGTPLAEVIAANGPPDQFDTVAGSWKWGRRMRRVPDNVKRIAVYNRAISPQVCAFLLDEKDVVVEIDRFAGYGTTPSPSGAGRELP